MLPNMRLGALAALVLLTGGVRPPAETAMSCYVCCSSYAVFFRCCYDPFFEYHAAPFIGSGVSDNGHTDCVWGGCLAYAALFPDETAVSTAAFLQRAAGWFAQQGITWRALMTDNGGGYRSHRFQALRRRLKLRHLWTRPYTPRTNGKAERFIRTCLERWAYAAAYPTSQTRARFLPEWLRYYNTERPHTALGFTTPMQRLAERR